MNLFWPVYKNLEKELLSLADTIHFNDKQCNVYSGHIADLLVRTAIEVESISRELYKNNGGNMNLVDDHGDPRKPFFDSDCIQFLDQKWNITKKVVNVVASNFYFEREENLVLHPLKDCNKQGQGRWKKAYQAVKHDRKESMDSGNIANLIRAMAALYVLNLYMKDDKIEELKVEDVFDLGRGSAVFSVNSFSATALSMAEHMNYNNIITPEKIDKDRALAEATFIDKYTEKSFIEMHKNFVADAMITRRNINESKEISEYIATHPEKSNEPLTIICTLCGEELEKKKRGIKDSDEIPEEVKEEIRQAGFTMLSRIIIVSDKTIFA